MCHDREGLKIRAVTDSKMISGEKLRHKHRKRLIYNKSISVSTVYGEGSICLWIKCTAHVEIWACFFVFAASCTTSLGLRLHCLKPYFK